MTAAADGARDAAGAREPGTAAVLTLRPEPYDSPAARRLVDEVQQEYVVRYGGPDATPTDPAEFAPPSGVFLVGYREVDGVEVAVACGGVRTLGPGVGEVKRMYVSPAHRRQGLSRQLLAALEQAAADLGCTELRLETGSRQPEAMALYASAGYRRIPSYGLYRDNPCNACFARRLDRAGPGEAGGAGRTGVAR